MGRGEVGGCWGGGAKGWRGGEVPEADGTGDRCVSVVGSAVSIDGDDQRVAGNRRAQMSGTRLGGGGGGRRDGAAITSTRWSFVTRFPTREWVLVIRPSGHSNLS